jgi:hypothetical protein
MGAHAAFYNLPDSFIKLGNMERTHFGAGLAADTGFDIIEDRPIL